MTQGNPRTHQDRVHQHDHDDEKLNPGMNSAGGKGAGADLTKPRGGAAAQEHPLDATEGEQAGTQRNPKFRTED